MIKLYGVPFSAHTRKVILALYEKQLSFESVPVIPLTPPEGWRQVSPLGLIPALHGYLKQLPQRECFQRAFAVELEAVKEVPELDLGFLTDMGVIRTEEAACSA